MHCSHTSRYVSACRKLSPSIFATSLSLLWCSGVPGLHVQSLALKTSGASWNFSIGEFSVSIVPSSSTPASHRETAVSFAGSSQTTACLRGRLPPGLHQEVGGHTRTCLQKGSLVHWYPFKSRERRRCPVYPSPWTHRGSPSIVGGSSYDRQEEGKRPTSGLHGTT